MLETFQYQVFSQLFTGKINCRPINIKNVYNWKCQRRIIGNIQFMVLWTHSIPTVIFREDCLTNRWKLTQWQQQLSCEVLIRLSENTARFVFSLFLCFPLLALIFVYLVITLPVFLPVSRSTVQSGPNLIASLRPFVLSRATGEQLLNVVHMVPGRLSWMHYQALKRRSCCTERLAMCELMSLSNPSYLKVLISALFHFVAISWDTTDAFCLLRHSKMIFIVSDSSFLKFSLCVLFWECI